MEKKQNNKISPIIGLLIGLPVVVALLILLFIIPLTRDNNTRNTNVNNNTNESTEIYGTECGNFICETRERWNCPQDCPATTLVDPGIVPCPYRSTDSNNTDSKIPYCSDDDYCKIYMTSPCRECSSLQPYCVSTNNHPETEFECYAAGGVWNDYAHNPAYPMRPDQVCVLEFPDANNACGDGSDCLSGSCYTFTQALQEQGYSRPFEGKATTGYCNTENTMLGCYFAVHDGRVAYEICVD